jgi:transposase
VRTFGTFTEDLHDPADWFKACGVTSVAMESTGVYWIPIYEILEQRGFEVIPVNARYAKNVPGRKADVSDAAWLRQLHSYGLLRGSFRPDAEIATLRAYLRQRERLVEYAAAHIQHMQKALDGDEPAAPSRGFGYHRRDRHADYPSYCCRRAQF